ncbi:VOC family protein [Dactylosporangium sp. NPDC049140]|jgi:catechol 2,3-dioxygenase-like lactoylglutathione lyase family enzyme|uniref:VOC family protein n=1 Tax=Dactylosporangium sp. NPDC049140 TaxID=3155647 RepID=UPI0033D009B2
MRLNVFGLVVADMPRSLAFYRRLGLDVPAAEDASPHVEHVLAGGVKLTWDTIETIHSFDPEWQPPVGGSRIGLAFECESPAEVDKVYAELLTAGYEGHKEPWDAFWGMRYAVVHDPDGNGVDLYAGNN